MTLPSGSTSSAQTGATERLAGLVADFRHLEVPKEAIRAAKRNILDTVGVAIAGVALETGRLIVDYARQRGGNPEAGVIASGFQTSIDNAALVNGVLAHAHLWEDTGTLLVAHPSSPLVAAILPLAVARACSGEDVLKAYIVGFELNVRFGRALNPTMYELGWHNTSVVGTLATTAAVAYLLRLPPAKIRMAIGTAVSLAAGSRQNFGTMTMALHIGNAARSGITAGLLAESGFTSDADSIEAPMGFANLFTAPGKHALQKLTEAWAQPLEVNNPGSLLKPYPSGGPTQNAINAVLAISTSEDLRPEDVNEIECRGPRWFSKTLIRNDPQTGIEGKTSLQYCVAAAMLDREVTMRQFTDAKVRASQARAMMRRVRVSVHPDFAEDVVDFGTEVIVQMKDGREFRRTVAKAKGHPDNPLSRDELLSKYRQCADVVLSERARERSIDLLEHLDELSNLRELSDIVCLLAPQTSK